MAYARFDCPRPDRLVRDGRESGMEAVAAGYPGETSGTAVRGANSNWHAWAQHGGGGEDDDVFLRSFAALLGKSQAGTEVSMPQRQPNVRAKPQAPADGLLGFAFALIRSAFDPYRPERHYMRGPGPKWRARNVGTVPPVLRQNCD
jgi:hypothetical protein